MMNDENTRFGWFEKTVKLVSKYGKGTVLVATVAIVLIATLVINPINVGKIFERNDDNKVKKHIELVGKREKANTQIPTILTSILFQTNAERVMIFEFHNGGSNHSDLPFYRFSCTYEVIKRSAEQYVSDSYQNQNVADYWQSINSLKDYGHIMYNNIDSVDSDEKVFYKMKKDGTKSVFFVRIFDNYGTFIGAVILSSSIPNSLDYDNIMEVNGRYMQQIGNLLTGTIHETR